MTGPAREVATPEGAPPRRSHRVSRRLADAGQAVIRRDGLMVTLMAVLMTCSAFAVWEATRAADRADDVLVQARILQAEQTRQAGYLQTLVDHDLSMLTMYCQSRIEQDTATATLLQNAMLGGEPDIPGLVSATLTSEALHDLLQGDLSADCPAVFVSGDDEPGYSVDRARQWVRDPQQGVAVGDTGLDDLLAEAEVLADDERGLMASSLFFVAALACLVVVDALQNQLTRPVVLHPRRIQRSQHLTLAAGTLCTLAGAALLVVGVVDPPYLLLLICSISLLVIVRNSVLLRQRGRPVNQNASASRRGRPHWWAEVTGALAIIIFSLAALGLSYVTTQERDLRAHADRQSITAQQLQQTGQQQALRDLFAVSVLARLSADQSAREQQLARDPEDSGLDEGEAHALREENQRRSEVMVEVDRRIHGLETGVRAPGPAEGAAVADCTPPDDTPPEAPATLREVLHDNPEEGNLHVLAALAPARGCDVSAALARMHAGVWAAHGSTFAVSLVVVGLAIFLLALAADHDRSDRSARALLAVGVAGTAAGLVIGSFTLPDIVWRRNVTEQPDITSFAQAVATGTHFPCDATDSLDAAIGMVDNYGPAYEARAYANLCEGEVNEVAGVLSSDLRPEVVPGIIEDFQRAMELGPRTALVEGNLGWVQILAGLHEGGAAADRYLRAGIESTERSIGTMEAQDAPPGTSLHIMRFNRALAIAALGETEAAVDAYTHATWCMGQDEEEERCEGGAVLAPELVDEVVLGALSDIELLEQDSDTDRYRHAILGALYPPTDALELADTARLDLFPQEVQVYMGDDWTGPGDLTAVWYYRPTEHQAWGVLRVPSSETLHPGPHGHRPWPIRALLPAGDYRVDVYAGGVRTVLHAQHSPKSLTRPPVETTGLSVAVPEDWVTLESTSDTWHLGPMSSLDGEYPPRAGIVLRRLEGVTPASDTEEWVTQRLEDEAARYWGESYEAQPFDFPYFLGLSDVVALAGVDGTTAVAGIAPYAEHSTDARTCGGTLVMALVGGPGIDEQLVDTVVESIVLERPQAQILVPVDPVVGDGFTVTVPDGWSTVTQPADFPDDALSSMDCGDGMRTLSVERTVDAGGVGEYVAEWVRLIQDPASKFPGITLDHREPAVVPGAVAAERLEHVVDVGGTPFLLQELFAEGVDGSVTHLTLLTPAEPVASHVDFDEIAGSLSLHGG